jgi:hypothetical protein
MNDAVDWKIIDENPFCKVKTQKSSVAEKLGEGQRVCTPRSGR